MGVFLQGRRGSWNRYAVGRGTGDGKKRRWRAVGWTVGDWR